MPPIEKKLPREDVNYSKDEHLKNMFIMLFGVLTIIILLFWCLGILGSYLAEQLSDTQEAKIAKFFSHKFKTSKRVKPEIQEKIFQMRNNLLAQVDNSSSTYSFDVAILCKPTINAYALPGGIIVLFSGLLEKLPHEEALSLILGHEMGHILHRDHLHQLGRSLVFMVIAMVFNVGSRDHMGNLLFNWTQNSLFTKFSRDQEKAADLLGLTLAHKAGINLFEAIILFDVLKSPDYLPDFFLTHPTSPKRKAYLRQMAEELSFPLKRKRKKQHYPFKGMCEKK